MPDTDLARRIARLEDIEAIRALKFRYCRLCDQSYDADALVELFAEDAVWEASDPTYGRYVGRGAIRDFFRTMPASVSFSVHTALNGEIEVHGDTASARFRAVIPASIRVDDVPTPFWLMSDYEDELRRVEGRWLFTRMLSIIKRTAPHGRGWE